MSDPIIRLALDSDIPRLEDLLYQVHGLHAEGRPDIFIPGCKKYTADQLREILADPVNTPVFVAIADGVLVGYCFCIRQVQTAASMQKISTLYVDDLCVDAAMRGKGFGKILYDHAVDLVEQVFQTGNVAIKGKTDDGIRHGEPPYLTNSLATRPSLATPSRICSSLGVE